MRPGSTSHALLLRVGHVFRAAMLIIAASTVAALFIKPTEAPAWIGAHLYPWLLLAAICYVPVLILTMAMALPRRMRFLGASLTLVLSYLFGVTLWILAACTRRARSSPGLCS